MIDEQRFRARLAALDAAARVLTGHARGHRLATDELLVTYAAYVEDWLMRPIESTPAAEPVDLAYDPKTQQSCGAYLRPDWYTGDAWAVCSGEHVDAATAGPTGYQAGWHKTIPVDGQDWTEQGIFATHHMVSSSTGLPYGRCACGEPWPCAFADESDDPSSPPAPGCDLVWRELMGGDHTHVCRNPTPDAPHICQTCGVAAHVDTIRP